MVLCFFAFVLRLELEVDYCLAWNRLAPLGFERDFHGIRDREWRSYFHFDLIFFFWLDLTSCKTHCDNSTNLPSCSGSIVCIISCNRPWRNFAPVCVLPAVPPLLLPVAPAWLEPAGPERVSLAARDVTEPPGCVAIDVSDEFAALPWSEGRTMDGWYGYGYGYG